LGVGWCGETERKTFTHQPTHLFSIIRLGVKVLRTTALRGAANKMAYFDVPTYATQDAMRIGRLHTYAAGWEDANVAFIQSGGYAMSSGPAELGRRGEPPTLIVWGRDDEILPPKESVDRIRSDIKHADFVWADACSHVPHLEQPAVLADAVAAFAGRLKKKESVEK
jgi:pimeloyl-ACP methyl ester carboxylesterase